MPAVGEHHPAFEEYCECIFELQEDDVAVIQARIAERLQVSRPAVSEMIRRLDTEGLITTDGAIRLTADGQRLAQRVVRRHRLAERFLTDMLGLSWADAHHEAGKWEHVMSDAVEAAMDRVLGNPTTCPHGNPIPGSLYAATAMVPLSQIAVGASFTVARIPEELEFADGVLDFLEEASILPGHTGVITGTGPDGTVTIEI
ncbi:MAG: metal-dependent transcriptional regulator, partial [Ilumatobacteraceae bacterium]